MRAECDLMSIALRGNELYVIARARVSVSYCRRYICAILQKWNENEMNWKCNFIYRVLYKDCFYLFSF